MEGIREAMIDPGDHGNYVSEFAMLFVVNKKLYYDTAARWSIRWANGDGGGFLLDEDNGKNINKKNENEKNNDKLKFVDMLWSHGNDCDVTEWNNNEKTFAIGCGSQRAGVWELVASGYDAI